MDHEELFTQIASGEGSVPTDPFLVQQLAQRAWEASQAPDEALRARGLAVALALPEDRALELAQAFIADPVQAIRLDAYRFATEHLPLGLAVVRGAASGPDHTLAAEALSLLTEHGDTSATTLARGLLTSSSGAVRAAAATLLGRVAGAVVVVQLRPLTDDPESQVRRAARRAIARILGEDEPMTTLDAPPAPPGDLPPPEVAPSAAAALEAVRQASTARRERPAATSASANAPVQRVVDAEPGSLWAPDEPLPLPDKLPTEALALVRLLGRVAVAHRPTLLDALRHADTSELASVVSDYQLHSDADRGRGIGLAAASMGNQRWVNALRMHLGDNDAGVRTTTLIALAGLPSPSLLPAIARCGSDPDPGVRASTAWCLGRAALALGAQDFAGSYLRALATDVDAKVQAAAQAALAQLGVSST